MAASPYTPPPSLASFPGSPLPPAHVSSSQPPPLLVRSPIAGGERGLAVPPSLQPLPPNSTTTSSSGTTPGTSSAARCCLTPTRVSSRNKSVLSSRVQRSLPPHLASSSCTSSSSTSSSSPVYHAPPPTTNGMSPRLGHSWGWTREKAQSQPPPPPGARVDRAAEDSSGMPPMPPSPSSVPRAARPAPGEWASLFSGRNAGTMAYGSPHSSRISWGAGSCSSPLYSTTSMPQQQQQQQQPPPPSLAVVGDEWSGHSSNSRASGDDPCRGRGQQGASSFYLPAARGDISPHPLEPTEDCSTSGRPPSSSATSVPPRPTEDARTWPPPVPPTPQQHPPSASRLQSSGNNSSTASSAAQLRFAGRTRGRWESAEEEDDADSCCVRSRPRTETPPVEHRELPMTAMNSSHRASGRWRGAGGSLVAEDEEELLVLQEEGQQPHGGRRQSALAGRSAATPPVPSSRRHSRPSLAGQGEAGPFLSAFATGAGLRTWPQASATNGEAALFPVVKAEEEESESVQFQLEATQLTLYMTEHQAGAAASPSLPYPYPDGDDEEEEAQHSRGGMQRLYYHHPTGPSASAFSSPPPSPPPHPNHHHHHHHSTAAAAPSSYEERFLQGIQQQCSEQFYTAGEQRESSRSRSRGALPANPYEPSPRSTLGAAAAATGGTRSPSQPTPVPQPSPHRRQPTSTTLPALSPTSSASSLDAKMEAAPPPPPHGGGASGLSSVWSSTSPSQQRLPLLPPPGVDPLLASPLASASRSGAGGGVCRSNTWSTAPVASIRGLDLAAEESRGGLHPALASSTAALLSAGGVPRIFSGGSSNGGPLFPACRLDSASALDGGGSQPPSQPGSSFPLRRRDISPSVPRDCVVPPIRSAGTKGPAAAHATQDVEEAVVPAPQEEAEAEAEAERTPQRDSSPFLNRHIAGDDDEPEVDAHRYELQEELLHCADSELQEEQALAEQYQRLVEHSQCSIDTAQWLRQQQALRHGHTSTLGSSQATNSSNNKSTTANAGAAAMEEEALLQEERAARRLRGQQQPANLTASFTLTLRSTGGNVGGASTLACGLRGVSCRAASPTPPPLPAPAPSLARWDSTI